MSRTLLIGIPEQVRIPFKAKINHVREVGEAAMEIQPRAVG